MAMKTILVKGVELSCMGEAIQHADAGGGEPITVGGKYLVVAQAEADRLAALGVSFAYLGMTPEDHQYPNRIVTIPIN